MPTKEERDARNARERERYEKLTPAEKEALLARHTDWSEKRKEEDPEGYRASITNKVANQRDRYKNDPEYRERVKTYQREAARERRKLAREAKEAAKKK